MMALHMTGTVLSEEILPAEGTALWLKRAALVGVGILALAASSKLSIPVGPVPVTMGTFAVLTIGAAYGTRLGLVTMLGYMLIGMLGFDVFAKTTAELNGWEYMTGQTGGYLLGFVLATLALGALARKGWDRSPAKMALAMVLGNVLIYIPGILWLGQLYGWDKPILDWGLYPFLMADGIKLVLAAMVLPALWAVVGKARG
jgi:biotin transport system substrate-specific component